MDHDNVNYLKKILGELAMVLDQVEAELEKRKLEYQGTAKLLSSIITAKQNMFRIFSNKVFMIFPFTLQVKSVSCGYVDLNLR